MTVLVLTAHDDDTAGRVCDALQARGCEHVRMGLGDFPHHVSFSGSGPEPHWAGWLSDGQHSLALADIQAVYWRRPTAFRLPEHLDGQQRRFAAAESRQGLGGLLSCLLVPFVNHPARVADAALKPAQLQAAATSGFVIPPTLITSSGAEARRFAGRYRKVLYKPLTSAFVRENGRTKLVYATLIDAGHSPARTATAATASPRPDHGDCGTPSKPPTSSGTPSTAPPPTNSASSPTTPSNSPGTTPTTARTAGPYLWSDCHGSGHAQATRSRGQAAGQ